MQNELIKEAEAIFKYQQQEKFINKLKEKHKITIQTKFYQSVIDAYVSEDDHGWIDKAKIKKTELDKVFIKIGNEKITLSNFIFNFNIAIQHVTSPSITEKDLTHFIDDYVSQNLLYLDVLENDFSLDKLSIDKIENKEHRLLYNKYLKEEVVNKAVFSEKDVKKHYEQNRKKWTGEYTTVISSVKNDLRKKLQNERYAKVLNKLSKKYDVNYNEALLQKLAKQLTDEKKVESKK